MTQLALVLALGAVLLPVGVLVSFLSLVALPLVNRLSPVARAEAAAWLALLPLLAVAGVGLAVLAPSLGPLLGVGSDHCFAHGHHAHLCLWHGVTLPPRLAGLGALAWFVVAVSVAGVLLAIMRAERLGRDLAALGRPAQGFHLVPATLPICHAVGLIRPRVLISEGVLTQLDGPGLTAVLAHEWAHIDRGDLRWATALQLAACFSPFGFVWMRTWRAAAEEAADDVAAQATDGPTVARALVAVARLQRVPLPGMAFGATGLERRVYRLLAAPTLPRPSRAFGGLLLMVVVLVVFVAGLNQQVHHEVEAGWVRLTAE